MRTDILRPPHAAPPHAPPPQSLRSPPAPELVAAWRLLMTVVARSLAVTVALVTRDAGGGRIEMTAPSLTPGCPYLPGALHDLTPGLLCEQVIRTRRELLVVDATRSRQWRTNPDVPLGLVAYLGYPVLWPDGEVFGTICVLDSRPRDFAAADRALLLSAREAIHDSLVASLDAPDPGGHADSTDSGDSCTPFGTWDLEPATGNVRLSPSLARFYGFEGSDQVGLEDWVARFPDPARERILAAIASLASGRWRTMTTSVIAATAGGPEVVRIAARGVPSASGVLSVVGLQTSMGVEAVRRLRDDGALSSEAFLEVTPDERISRVSAAMRVAVGLPADACDRPLADAFAGMYDGAAALEAMRRALAGDVRGEVTLVQACPNEASHVALVDSLREGSRVVGGRLVLVPDDVNDPSWTTTLVHDAVTGLPTRAELERRLLAQLRRIDPPGDHPVLLLTVVEVTNVEDIVRAHGHRVADACLVSVADGLRGADRFVAALGLGYFAVLHRDDRGESATASLPVPTTTWVGPGPGRVEPRFAVGSAPVFALGTTAPGKIVAAVINRMVPIGTAVEPVANPLTAREREIATLVVSGLSNREVAARLFIAVRTVEGHLDRVREKFEVSSRTQLVARALTSPELLRG